MSAGEPINGKNGMRLPATATQCRLALYWLDPDDAVDRACNGQVGRLMTRF